MMFQSTKTKAKQVREPPPSLFLGPPSQNASHVSLPGVGSVQPPNPSVLNPARAPLLRQSSKLSQRVTRADDPPDAGASSALPRPPLPRQQQASERRKQADRTDAQWAQMQATLEEVELSAASGTHVFGAEHARALEGLRSAQIELAKAWARSEAEDLEGADKESKGFSASGKGMQIGSDGKSVLDGSTSAAPSGGARPGSSGGPERFGEGTEEETDADILLARKRREANDRYFARVNEGVLDVVARLEDVASAMKAVEQESRDIWGETGSSRASVQESQT